MVARLVYSKMIEGKGGCGTKDIETKRRNMSCESIVSCLVLLIVDETLNCQLIICLLVLSCIMRLQAGVTDVEGKIDIFFGAVVHDFGFVGHVTSSLSSLGCCIYLFDLNQFDHRQVLDSSLPEELDM